MVPKKTPPVAPAPEPSRSPVVPPRWLVTVVTLAALAAMLISAARGDYRSMAVAALLTLLTLGVDVGAVLRAWRGGGQG